MYRVKSRIGPTIGLTDGVTDPDPSFLCHDYGCVGLRDKGSISVVRARYIC